MTKFLKQFIFVSSIIAIILVGGLAIYGAIPQGKVKVNPILGHDLDLDAKYYGQAANNTVHDITTQDISISAWVKVDVDANSFQHFFNKYAVLPGYYFRIRTDGKLHFKMFDGTDEYYIVGNSNIRDNKWHYVAVIIDRDNATNCKIFLDGYEDGATSKIGTLANVDSLSNSQILRLGAYAAGDSVLDGQIRDVKLYYANNDHWTDAQILYQAQHPFDYSANAGTLTDYWRLDEGTGTTLYGKVNNLTLSNVLAWTTQPKIKMVKQENTTSTTNNPVGWWKFDETTAIDGSVMADSSGNGNHGTLSTGDGSTEKSVAGKLGRALSFDGVNDCVNVADSASLMPINDMTIEAWLNVSYVDKMQYFIAKSDLSSVGYFALVSNAVNGYVILFSAFSADGVSGNKFYIHTPYASYYNKWTHFVAVINGQNAYIYLNGVLKNTQNKPGFTGVRSTVSSFRIGYPWSNLTPNGLIDDVRIYDRALGAEEVAQMYNSTKDGYLGNVKVSTGLVGYWKMDDNADNTQVKDYSGKNNNGVFTDATGNPFTSAHATSGQVGGAMVFDGVDDYVSMATSTTLINFTAKSVFMWAKIPAFTGTYRSLMNAGYGTSLGGDMFFLWNNANNYHIYLKNTAGTASFKPDIPYTPDTWTYIGYTWDGTTVRYYKNGVYLGFSLLTGTLSCAGISLSFGDKPYAGYFNGLIDEVKIWNYARSAEEIKQDYERGLRGLP